MTVVVPNRILQLSSVQLDTASCIQILNKLLISKRHEMTTEVRELQNLRFVLRIFRYMFLGNWNRLNAMHVRHLRVFMLTSLLCVFVLFILSIIITVSSNPVSVISNY